MPVADVRLFIVAPGNGALWRQNAGRRPAADSLIPSDSVGSLSTRPRHQLNDPIFPVSRHPELAKDLARGASELFRQCRRARQILRDLGPSG